MTVLGKLEDVAPGVVHKWTDKDLCEFAEWCSARQWFITQDGLWYKLTGHISKYGDNYEKKTTSQLLEVWEVETGRRPKP